MLTTRLWSVLSAAFLVFAPCVYAQTPAYSILSTGGVSSDPTPASIGLEFTTTQTLYLTELGYANVHGSDGFSFSHVVGIYDSAGDLIVSTSLASGNSGHTVGGDSIFRYQDIDYTLAPGNYVLAGNTDGAEGGYRTDAGLTYAANAAVNFEDPTGSGDTPYLYTYNTGGQPADQLFLPVNHFNFTSLYAGPNFLFSVSPSSVPEPGAFPLVTSGASALLFGLWRRRKRPPLCDRSPGERR